MAPQRALVGAWRTRSLGAAETSQQFMASDQTSDIGSAAAEDGVKDPLLSLRHPSLSTRCPSGAPHALSEHPPRLPGESHSKQSVFVVVFENKLMSDWLESRMIGGPTVFP